MFPKINIEKYFMNVNYRVEEWLLLPWYLLHSIPSSVACAVFTQISENNTEEGEAVNFLTQKSERILFIFFILMQF